MNIFPVFFKTEDGGIINLSMITHIYKRNGNKYMIEFVNGRRHVCQISQEVFEQIYKLYRYSVD